MRRLPEEPLIKPGDEVMYVIDGDPGVFTITVSRILNVCGRTFVEGTSDTGEEHFVSISRILPPEKEELPDGPNKSFRKNKGHTA